LIVNADELSEAIVLWCGYHSYPSPRLDEARVVTRFGEQRALDLIPLVRRLADEFDASDAAHTEPDIKLVGDKAAADFRAAHPELSEDAIEALAWCYTFRWK
jgi:hypothetical protein